MARLSIEGALKAAAGFVRAEWRLLLPVALAFHGLPSAMFWLLAPEAIGLASGRQPTTGEALALLPWALPVLGFGLLANLAISALTLSPGVSVREALALAARRWPAAAAAILLVGLGIAVAASVVGVAAGLVLAVLGAGAAAVQALLVVVLTGAMIWGAVRLLVVIVPLVADRAVGPVAAIRQCWALTRRQAVPLVALLLIVFAGIVAIVVAAQLALGVVLLLIGRMIGLEVLAAAVLMLLMAAINAALTGALSVVIATAYRQLALIGR